MTGHPFVRKNKHALTGVLVLVAALLTVIVVMAVQNLRLPDVHVVQDAALAFVASAAAIFVIVAGAGAILAGFVHGLHFYRMLAGALLIFMALPLLGVVIGLPPWLDTILNTVNLIVQLLNTMINLTAGFFGFIGHLFGG